MENKKKITGQNVEGYSIRIFPWFFLTLLVCIVIFFIFPALFNVDNTFSPYTPFPRLNPIGKDLADILDFSRAWLQTGSPYVGTNYYPPLQAVFFAPLTALSYSRAYKILTALSLLSYVSLFFFFYLLGRKTKILPGWLIAIPLVGLFSYGLLFQLERGQYDLITMAICIGAIYLFHFKPRLRILSYLLFCIAVQLKIFPLIFLVAFIDYSQPRGAAIKRWAGLILTNLLLLFSLGWSTFLAFIQTFLNQVQHPTYAWIGNHSINSFLSLPQDEPDHYSPGLINFVDRYGQILQGLLLAIILACILYLVIQTYRKTLPPYNPFLMLGCMLGTMLIPSTSHDYKLSLLGPVVAALFLFLIDVKIREKASAIWISLITGVISLSFSISLFVLYARPYWLRSSFPLLLTMLLLTAILFGVIYRKIVPAGMNTIANDPT